MEFLRGDQPELEPTSEDSGEFDATKKRRKKVTKIAKKSSLFRSAAQEVKEPAEKQSDAKESTKERTLVKKIETKGPELELPEVAETPQGELKIDHTTEQTVNEVEKSVERETSEDIDAEVSLVSSHEVSPETVEEETDPEAEVSEEEVSEEPPRVAPPLLFEFPIEALRTPEPMPEPTKVPVATPEVTKPVSTEAPAITPHHLHPGYRERMFNPNNETLAEPVVTERETRRREHIARRKGVSRGVVAGGIAGWWFGRRRAENIAAKEMNKQLKTRDETIKKLAEEKAAEQEQARKRLSVLERTQQEFEKLKKQALDRAFSGHRQEVTPPEQDPLTSLMPEAKPLATPLSFVEQAPQRETFVTETVPVSNTPEVLRQHKTETLASMEKKLPIEDRLITEELFAVPEGRRVEMSAWHRIEVDETTGRAVEKPSTEYGEAFVREQQQERLARDAAAAQTAAQVGMTLLSPLADSQNSMSTSSESSVAKQSKVSSFAKSLRKDMPFIRQQLIQHTSSPVTWAAAAVLVVMLFAVGAL